MSEFYNGRDGINNQGELPGQETETSSQFIEKRNGIIIVHDGKKKKKYIPRWRVILCMLVMFAVFLCESKYMYDFCVKVTNGAGKNASAIDSKEQSIRKLIEDNYLNADSLSENTIDDGKYAGMLASLGDPYSVYYTEKAFEELVESTEGTFYGIGVYLTQSISTNEIRVVKPMKGSPAMEAGIVTDDILIKVNGEDIRDQELSLVVSKVKGPESTTVDLTFLRGREEYTCTVKRAKVEVSTVEYRMEDEQARIGYIQVTEFDEVTYNQFIEAIDELKEQGMKSLIIDLRGNPGGNVDTVVKMCDELLPEGVVVYTEDRNGHRVDYNSDGNVRYTGDMVVLVDGNSASASEIMTGALKDYKKATIMGTTTFGKGIVQRVFSLRDGTAVKITVENYFTPLGNNIHELGIEPDVEVKFDVDQYTENEIDNQLNAAVDYLKNYNSLKKK